MLGEFPKAEHAARTLIAINPAHRNAYKTLGWACQMQGRLDEAMAGYLKQIEVNPKNPYAPTNLSHIHASRGQLDQARHWAEIAAVIPVEMAARWYFLGKTKLKTGRPTEARQSFDHALALPHDPMVENDIAYDLADAGYDLDRSWTLISGAMQKSIDPLFEPKAVTDGDLCTAQSRQLA
jgi:tetratricopeptide (TPR) repeat protein